MSRAFDFVVVTVIAVVAVVIHIMGLELFAPGTPLYQLATDGTSAMNGTARANLWYEILTLWVPMLAVGGISAWAVIREYRRQIQTAPAPRPR